MTILKYILLILGCMILFPIALGVLAHVCGRIFEFIMDLLDGDL